MDDAKKLRILAQINRASHFQWRKAALAASPDLDALELVKRYWGEVGRETARYYLSQIDRDRDLAEQVTALFVSSSVVMAEDAVVIEKSAEGRCQARHNSCPWFDWHRREDLLPEDQPGCDHFLQVLMDEMNAALGSRLRFATVESLPNGGACCLHQFWEEDE